MVKCLYCRKETNRKKYCSNKCKNRYSIENKIGIFNIKNIRKTHEIQKQKKLGFWNKETVIKMNVKANKTNKKNRTAVYGLSYKDRVNNQKISDKICKINKTGFYNKELQKELGKKGGIKAIEVLRKKKKIIYNGIYFDSRREREIALNLYKQRFIKKLINRKNCHVLINNKEYDFLIEKLKILIEYHPWDINGLSDEEYKNIRIENLNRDYNKYNLVILK